MPPPANTLSSAACRVTAEKMSANPAAHAAAMIDDFFMFPPPEVPGPMIGPLVYEPIPSCNSSGDTTRLLQVPVIIIMPHERVPREHTRCLGRLHFCSTQSPLCPTQPPPVLQPRCSG